MTSGLWRRNTFFRIWAVFSGYWPPAPSIIPGFLVQTIPMSLWDGNCVTSGFTIARVSSPLYKRKPSIMEGAGGSHSLNNLVKVSEDIYPIGKKKGQALYFFCSTLPILSLLYNVLSILILFWEPCLICAPLANYLPNKFPPRS